MTKTYNINVHQIPIFKVVADATKDTSVVTGSGIYQEGQTANITVAPKQGFLFLQWTDDNKEVSRTYTGMDDKEFFAQVAPTFEGELKYVDENNRVYTKAEYDTITTKPTIIGVGLEVGEELLVFYFNEQQLKLAEVLQLPTASFTAFPSEELLYNHSGKERTQMYYDYNNTVGAPVWVKSLTNGGNEWWIPSIFELTALIGRHSDFNEFFTNASLTGLSSADDLSANGHGYWSSDMGYGGSMTADMILPYRVYRLGNKVSYWSSGNYCYPSDANPVRPCTRLNKVEFDFTGSGTGQVYDVTDSANRKLVADNWNGQPVYVKKTTSDSPVVLEIIGWDGAAMTFVSGDGNSFNVGGPIQFNIVTSGKFKIEV